ncbi:hypothetical protein OIV83_005674 [Microbotryomycetes sp. JL201]|nr:hypothetical protein OIV83_005674 [Microbotryomycetes sp. JL201]
MRRLAWLVALIYAGHGFAAPAFAPTAGALLAERDVNIGIQVGAVSTVTLERTKTTVTTEVEGQPTVVPTVIETETTMTVTSVATAVVTQIATQTVVEGVTRPVTVTTTGYDVHLATQMVTVPHTTTYFTQEVKVVTVQGQPITSTISILTTELPTTKPKPRPTMDDSAPSKNPKQDEHEQEDGEKDKPEREKENSNDENRDAPPRPKERTATRTITSLATSTDALGSTSISTVLVPTATVVNSADADNNSTSGAEASADSTSDSTNTNQNSIEIWMQEGNNKTYVIVGAVVAGVCLVGVILAIVFGHKSSPASTVVSYGPSYDRNGSNGDTGRDRSQTINMSQGQQPSTVAASMSRRPKYQERRKYARVGRDSSEQESGDDDEKMISNRARGRLPSTRSSERPQSRSQSRMGGGDF